MSPSRGKPHVRPLQFEGGGRERVAAPSRRFPDPDSSVDCSQATGLAQIAGHPRVARAVCDGRTRGDTAQNAAELLLEAAIRPSLGPLIGVARRILHDGDLARDAVQEALISLWLEDELPPNPPAWLVRAVVLRSLQMNRGRARRRKHEGQACRERVEPSDRDDPARILVMRELRERLLAAVRLLPKLHQEVFTLRTIEGMEYESIALQLQVPIGTVRSRLSRARIEIRRVVEESLSDDLAEVATNPSLPARLS
jgi:RNA polymerase sigma-70 factor, ECF subfamily